MDLHPNKEALVEQKGLPEVGVESGAPVQSEAQPESLEQKESLSTEKSGEAYSAVKPANTVAPAVDKQPAAVLVKSETLKEIEGILSEGLAPVYQKLPANVQAQFRKKGEETASQIEKLIFQTKIAVGKILNLIINWLKVIPGVNKLFLEQESKIKTDKILVLAEKRRKQKIEI